MPTACTVHKKMVGMVFAWLASSQSHVFSFCEQYVGFPQKDAAMSNLKGRVAARQAPVPGNRELTVG